MADIRLEPLPPAEAIAFFEAKGLKIGFSWLDVYQQENQSSFTVAKVMQLDLLADIQGSILAVQKEGITYQQWAKDLKPTLVKKGWWGKATMTDPLTGEQKLVQLGSTRRLKVIYDTNLRTAHSEGQWERIQQNKEAFPYLQYDANNSERPRAEHSAWDGLVLPVDDPFWQAHMPVKEWGCKCRVRALTRGQAQRLGVKIGPAPEIPKERFVNKRTGQVSLVPKGVHPAFHYPPGGRQGHLARHLTDSAAAASPEIGAAMAGPLAQQVRAIQAEFTGWVDALSKTMRPAGELRTVGVLAQRVLEHVRGKGIEPASAGITVQDRDVVHMLREVKVRRGSALAVADVKQIPAIVAAPKAVLWDKQDPALLYVFDPIEGDRAGKIVVRLDYFVKDRNTAGKRVTVKTNSIRTGSLVQRPDLMIDRYELLEGEL